MFSVLSSGVPEATAISATASACFRPPPVACLPVLSGLDVATTATPDFPGLLFGQRRGEEKRR